MMKKSIALIFLFGCIVICSYTGGKTIPFPTPSNWPEPAYDFKESPLFADKVALGKKLFFDPLMSRDNTVSCSSCHLPQTGFTHVDHDLSHGIENRIGTRNSLALMNLAWSKSFMWDGAIHHLDVQALAPITNHNEMDEKLENIVTKLKSNEDYVRFFSTAFDDGAITGQHVLQSLSQFMLTLISKDSKYDRVMRKEPGVSFNEYEARGYEVFKSNCSSCHTEPLFTNNSFENNGLPIDTTLNDLGLAKITGKKEDEYKFKVPTLRNIEVTYPYMHDGRFRSLQMVLFHYSTGIHQSENTAPQLKNGLALNEQDKQNLIGFLKTLTDETFLHSASFISPKE